VVNQLKQVQIILLELVMLNIILSVVVAELLFVLTEDNQMDLNVILLKDFALFTIYLRNMASVECTTAKLPQVALTEFQTAVIYPLVVLPSLRCQPVSVE
jgi:hypothetical protein